MYNYSRQILEFRNEKVRLPTEFKDKLYTRRDANRDRLVSRLPERIKGLSISNSSFKPQGSMAIDTIVQTKFIYEEYDIDDGIVLNRADLVDKEGNELSSKQVKEHVLESLKDDRFAKQPAMCANAVRVFYKESDEERHHVDFPTYRRFENDDGNIVRELAGEEGWIESDPTQVNRWFLDQIKDRNNKVDGRGTQLRHLIQLMKRFCRSRNNWDMPNGMKLTMLVAALQPSYDERIDLAFRSLLEQLELRLPYDKTIQNLAHPDKPKITRTSSDLNMVNLEEKVGEALERLRTLDDEDNNNRKSAREVWDWIFRSDGFFSDFDKEDQKKACELKKAAALVASGNAHTNTHGQICHEGVPNRAHKFYGDTF